MKKILGLTIAALLILAVVGGGTWAYFSDTATSGTNTLTAGTLNLAVASQDSWSGNLTFSDIQPGDTDNSTSWLLRNDGSINAQFSVNISSITNNENTYLSMELPAGDSTSGALTGELGGLLTVAFIVDTNKNGDWDGTDYFLDAADNTTVAYSIGGPTWPAAAFHTLDSYSGKEWINAQAAAQNADIGNFVVAYDFPDAGTNADNQAQSDSNEFTITFELKQS